MPEMPAEKGIVHEASMPRFRSVQDILDFAIGQEIEP
jgi:hypothetical protein